MTTRDIAGSAFALAGPIEAVRDDHGAPILDEPQHRFTNPRGLSLNRYGAGPFARLQIPTLPARPGVYAVFDHLDSLLYIGRARDSLARRWGRAGYAVIDPRNCFAGGQSTNCRLNSLITQALIRGDIPTLWVHVIEEPTPLEAALITGLRPPWNLRSA